MVGVPTIAAVVAVTTAVVIVVYVAAATAVLCHIASSAVSATCAATVRLDNAINARAYHAYKAAFNGADVSVNVLGDAHQHRQRGCGRGQCERGRAVIAVCVEGDR